MATKPLKPLKGASPLKLNNTELRRELHRADRIIDCAIASLNGTDKTQLLFKLTKAQITTLDDITGLNARKQAMHRITAKRDYLKMALIVFTTIFAFAWYTAHTENQLLQAELAISNTH